LVVVSAIAVVVVARTVIDYGFQKASEIVPLFQDRSTKDQLWRMVDEAWQPPAEDTPLDQLFPAQFEGWRRVGSQASAGIPEIDLRRDGFLGSYQNGQKTVDIFVCRLPEAERDQVFENASEAINRLEKNIRLSFSASGANSRRYLYAVDLPPNRGVLWWSRGWLFVARSKGEDPETVLISYLQKISSAETPLEKPSISPPSKPGI
jgi:hypothetical protein